MNYEAVIGLEVHVEMLTRTKMFCSCPLVDYTTAAPNSAVCPVCSGMPGVLPVVNKQAVEYGIRVGLALNCSISETSIFARKNYFYPDLPKGYQISQYEYPLAQNGWLDIHTSQGDRRIRILRAHLEEDAGKLTHVNGNGNGEGYSLVDLNRAGVALLEIVTMPDMHTAEEACAYARALHAVIRCLGVNSGDMSKGVMRLEANVSVRPAGSDVLNNRVEIKNLNSFRAMERAINYQIEQQIQTMQRGGTVDQETMGWDDARGVTYSMRSKEEAHDYRYFPEPDLPPLVVESEWVERVRAALPELPQAKAARFQQTYGLPEQDAEALVDDPAVADYFEAVAAGGIAARSAANWIIGEIFAWFNQSNESIDQIKVAPTALVEVMKAVESGKVNLNTGKSVLAEMLKSGKSAAAIIVEKGLEQISDSDAIAGMIRQVLEANPKEVASYLEGKETLAQWFFGQVMRTTRGKANPQVIQAELNRQLAALKEKR
jgi:aspartyl-tRNA(Asn)/glutamyl-tRNA(Gln) amidotransferase subunit B